MDENNKIIEILKKVIDPETGVDIVSEGMVYGFTINEMVTEIWMSFSSATPVCFFCKAVAWTEIEKISNCIVEELGKEGYKNIRVVESLNPKIYYKTS